MNRQVVVLSLATLACVVASATAGVLVAACGGTNKDTASGAVGGDSGGSGDDGGAAPSCPAPSSPLLIDDMSVNGTDGPGTGGYWFTYSDRTNPYSGPPIYLAPPAPGTITPKEGQSFYSNAPGPGTITNARECMGGGESNWGAGFGFDLIDTKPDGGNKVPFWECDGGGEDVWNDSPDGGNGIPLPFNASAHKGVSFLAKSNTGAPVDVYLKFSEKRTNAWGGVCNACATQAVDPMEQCSDDYLKILPVMPGWNSYTVHWTDLATQNFTKINLPPGGFDATTFYSLHFQFHTRLTPLAPFDVTVACVQFVDE
jgi:hypothetical protein